MIKREIFNVPFLAMPGHTLRPLPPPSSSPIQTTQPTRTDEWGGVSVGVGLKLRTMSRVFSRKAIADVDSYDTFGVSCEPNSAPILPFTRIRCCASRRLPSLYHTVPLTEQSMIYGE